MIGKVKIGRVVLISFDGRRKEERGVRGIRIMMIFESKVA